MKVVGDRGADELADMVKVEGQRSSSRMRPLTLSTRPLCRPGLSRAARRSRAWQLGPHLAIAFAAVY